MVSFYSVLGILLQTVLLTVALASNLEAQPAKSVKEVLVKVEFKNAALADVFESLEHQTAFRFVYDVNDEFLKKRFNYPSGSVSVESLLLELSRQRGLAFKQVNNSITVKKIKKKPLEIVINAINISGRVTSSDDGQGIPGVSVTVQGTSQGTVTDVEGNYNLEVPDENATLVFSYVGFISETVTVGSQTVINVELVPDVIALGEIIVVGYGTQERKDITGSIASLNMDEVKDLPVASFDQALAGRLPGVQVTQANAAPGGAVSIRIRGGNSLRGNNEPLYVIDGLPIATNNQDNFGNVDFDNSQAKQRPNILNSINPNDIESIQVLKDASATAIYGSRGANGVIIITTKKGKANRKELNFDAYYGTQQVANELDMLNATQYNNLLREARENSNLNFVALPTDVNTDWQDVIYQLAPMQNYNLSYGGGTENSRFRVSANYFNQEGILEGSGIQRYAARFNNETYVGEKLTLGANVSVTRTENETTTANGGGLGAVSRALVFAPNQPIISPNGNYTQNIFPNTGVEDFEDSSPAYLVNDVENEVNSNRILGNLYAQYELIEGLNLKVNLGADFIDGKQVLYLPETRGIRLGRGGAAQIIHNTNRNLLIENTIDYTRAFGDHQFTFLTGQTAQSYESESSILRGEGLAPETKYWDLARNTQPDVGLIARTRFNDWTLFSYLGRVNYSYKDRYLLTASVRWDGSSRLGENNRWGTFPAASAAWVISEESFFSDVSQVENLKLRVGYGVTGNTDIGSYRSLVNIRTDNQIVLNGVNNVIIGAWPASLPNPDLQWERTSQFNVGMDVTLFKGRLTATVDYYNKNTEELLWQQLVPLTTGYSSIETTNIGSVENRGFELGLSGDILTGELQWQSSVNFSLNRNELTSLGPDITENVSNDEYLQVGQPVGVFYGLRTDGLFQVGDDNTLQPNAEPGDQRFLDINSFDDDGNVLAGVPDGEINAADRTIIGDPNPDFTFGFNNTLRYKSFDLSIFIQGVIGNDIYNENLNSLLSLDGRTNNLADANNRWTPNNTNTDIPRALFTPADNTGGGFRSDFYVEDGSFVRLNNVTLGYNLPASVLSNIGLSNLRVYFSGQNLLVITDYSGYDPEVNIFEQNNLRIGIDNGAYPRARTYLLGLNISF